MKHVGHRDYKKVIKESPDLIPDLLRTVGIIVGTQMDVYHL